MRAWSMRFLSCFFTGVQTTCPAYRCALYWYGELLRNLPLPVTKALLLPRNASTQIVVYVDMNMENTNSMRVRASRFLSDRYAYRAQPNYLSELVAFGIIVSITVWPIILLANAMAAAPK
jgi:hypothetical protein